MWGRALSARTEDSRWGTEREYRVKKGPEDEEYFWFPFSRKPLVDQVRGVEPLYL